MKTIKLIDLFIKIANGEDTPNAIKFNNKIFTHNGTGLNHNYYCEKTDEILEETFILSELNDEVEIIEDISEKNKKIENFHFSLYQMERLGGQEVITPLETKINEIIDMINGDSNERDN